MKPPKIDKKPLEILSLNDIMLLLSQPGEDNAKELRDKTMLMILYTTGIRVSDILAIKISDVNLKLNYFICHGEKGDKVVAFSNQIKQLLERYISLSRSKLIMMSK